MKTVCEYPGQQVTQWVRTFGADLNWVEPGHPIPGSYWDAPEAGLIGNQIFVAPDTPVHSLAHELGHYICMPASRRARLHTDAGGTDFEECAVCYLQIHLAHAGLGRPFNGSFQDLDDWGYSFRLGSALRWYEQDAFQEREWLEDQGLLDSQGMPTGKLRS